MAERVLSLEGGRNFRDLGGYSTGDGRRVKWGKLYRSGSMAGLTAGDLEHLAALGVRTVCDLRTTFERAAHPTDWGRIPRLSYWARDYELSFGDLRTLLASGLPSAQQARAAMAAAYRELPFEQAPAYGELFRRLAAGELPLVFNCSAGKDRTGVAAALILDALGVPQETIIEDYLLTNTVYDYRGALGRPGQAGPLSSLPPEVVSAIMGSDESYISAALEAINENHGSIAAYLQETLGMSEATLSVIRSHLLE